MGLRWSDGALGDSHQSRCKLQAVPSTHTFLEESQSGFGMYLNLHEVSARHSSRGALGCEVCGWQHWCGSVGVKVVADLVCCAACALGRSSDVHLARVQRCRLFAMPHTFVVPDLPGSACSDSDVDVLLSAVLAPMRHALAVLHALATSRAGSSGQISVMCGLGVDTLARVMDVTAGAARALCDDATCAVHSATILGCVVSSSSDLGSTKVRNADSRVATAMEDAMARHGADADVVEASLTRLRDLARHDNNFDPLMRVVPKVHCGGMAK